MSLVEKKCQACEGGIPPIGLIEAQRLIKEIPGWTLDPNGKFIERSYSFKGFYATMSFTNAVAYLAQKEGHHPDMRVGYNYLVIRFTTHAIDGLSENDFICAAKINQWLSDS